MKCLCALISFVVISCSAAQAASLYSSVREGVDLYEDEQYEEALKILLDAQVEHPENILLKFDIASCQYKLQKYEDAAAGYLEVVSTARDAELETQALYNLGNAMYRQGKLEESVEYYKKTLELDSEDEDARKNLEFVREEIKRQKNEARETQERQQDQQDKPDGQQDQQDGQQDKQDSQQDKQDSQQDKQDSQQDKQDSQQDKQDSQQDKQDGQQNQQQQGSPDGGADEQTPQPAGGSGLEDESQQAEDALRDIAGAERPMSKEEAEQWLRGLEENREKLQEFRRRSRPGKPTRPEKDW